jgi:hypothetical protein
MRARTLMLSLSIGTLALAAMAAPSYAVEPPKVTVEPPKISTPPNPAKLPEFRVSKAVGTIPTVTPRTIQLAHEHDEIAAREPAHPIRLELREAKTKVLERDNSIAADRQGFKTEISSLEGKANALENPTTAVTAQYGVNRFGQRIVVRAAGNVPREPTVEELRQSAEGYVGAAQVGRVKAGNFERRLGEEQPDLNTTGARAEDLDTASRLYGKSAAVLDKLSTRLQAQGDNVGAQQAHDKAQNTRFVAERYAKFAQQLKDAK